jgi:hypothetical protein
MPPLAIAGGVAAAGLAVKGIAGAKAAKAKGSIAQQQEAQAAAERQAVISAAAPSVGELQAAEKQMQVADRAIARQEELLNAVDPSLIEAGKQALGLLKGEDVKSLDPLKRNRDRQRALLQNQLRERLGAGYETSSAGSEALNRFDQQTSETLAGAQEQTLGRLLGVAAGVRPDQGQLVGLGGVGLGTQTMFQNRLLNATAGAPSLVDTVGGKQKGQAAKFGNIADIGGGIASIAGKAAGAIAGGGLSGIPSAQPAGPSTGVFSGTLGDFGKTTGAQGPTLFG